MEDRQGTLNGTDHPPPPHVGRPVRGTNPKVLDLWTVPHPVLANSMDAHYGATTWNELVVAPILAITAPFIYSWNRLGIGGALCSDVCTLRH